ATDTGILALTNSNNNYAGFTDITGGATVQIDADNELGNTLGVEFFAGGGTLATTATFSTNRFFALFSPVTFNVATGTTLTVTGLVANGGSVVKANGGALVLTNTNNNYNGTTING